MKIAIGSDHRGTRYRAAITAQLEALGHSVTDVGTTDEGSVDYPDFARAVAEQIKQGRCERGILICAAGIGMSMAANKVHGIRAALATDPFMAKMATEHNDANVLCVGERVIGEGLALEILDAFLGAEFGGGRHERRVGKIMDAEAG